MTEVTKQVCSHPSLTPDHRVSTAERQPSHSTFYSLYLGLVLLCRTLNKVGVELEQIRVLSGTRVRFSLQWSQHSKVAEERLHSLARGTRRALRGTETLCSASSKLPQSSPPSPHQVPEEELPPPAPPFTREWLHQHRLPARLILNELKQQMFGFQVMFIFFNNLPTNRPPSPGPRSSLESRPSCSSRFQVAQTVRSEVESTGSFKSKRSQAEITIAHPLSDICQVRSGHSHGRSAPSQPGSLTQKQNMVTIFKIKQTGNYAVWSTAWRCLNVDDHALRKDADVFLWMMASFGQEVPPPHTLYEQKSENQSVRKSRQRSFIKQQSTIDIQHIRLWGQKHSRQMLTLIQSAEVG